MRCGFCVMMLMAGMFAGCNSSYMTPGGRADFSELGLSADQKAALTDNSVQVILDKKPLVTFPATIAVARVQATDYDSYTYHRFYTRADPESKYSVITIPDVETDADFIELGKLPRIGGVAMIKRILLDNRLNSDLELRNAAAKVHANLLLYYTLDTQFQTDTHVAPLGLVTLGLFPNRVANVTTTASGVLMDVNNGYVYCVGEASAKNDQLANAWNTDEAMDQVRRKTEREAFVGLLGQLKTQWPSVVATYDHPAP